jgi:hypothetical protein
MRTYQWLAAAAVTAALAAPSGAQAPVLFNGTAPNLTFQPIDLSNANVPIAQPQGASGLSSKLSGFFHMFSPPRATPVIGTSTFPTRAQSPGLDYLKGFGYRRPGPGPG